MQKKFKYFSNKIEFFLKKSCKIFRFFFSICFFCYFLVGNHLKHVEMQKQKFKYFFQNGRHSGHFGPSPKSNGMIPWTRPNPPTKFCRNPSRSFSVILFTNKRTNKQTGVKTVTSVHLRWRRLTSTWKYPQQRGITPDVCHGKNIMYL